MQTGEWFHFLEVQKYWGKNFRLPTFPLTTWSAHKLLWLDASAFFVGVMSMATLLFFFFKKFFLRKKESISVTPELSFSLTYLALTMLVTLFLLIIDDVAKTTPILSINRYIFATPFLFIAMLFYLKQKKQATLVYCGFLALLLITVNMFGFYQIIPGIETSHFITNKTFLFLSIMVTYFLLFILSVKRKIFNIAFYLFILYNFIIQILLFERFLTSGWVG